MARLLLLINDVVVPAEAAAAVGAEFILVNIDFIVVCLVFCFLEGRFVRAAGSVSSYAILRVALYLYGNKGTELYE